jgi:hypothetical protein
MRSFLAYVDAEVRDAAAASLARLEPDLQHAVTEWVRILPSRHAPGSRMPGWYAGLYRANTCVCHLSWRFVDQAARSY